MTNSYGVNGYSSEGYGHGVSFADINGDGKYDLFVSNAIRELILPDMLYFNNTNNFVEAAAQRGVDDLGLTHSIITMDIDNDGDLDVFFANMSVYSDKHLGYGRNALYSNNGQGMFQDITDLAGISDELNDTRGAIAVDINNDGWLDLYGVNWGQPCEMYLNDKSGKFTRVHRGADGPSGDTSAKQGVTAADFDNDGDIDIYVSRREDRNWLFVNDGQGNFVENAQQLGVDVDGRTNGAVFADIDNDADLDLFVINYAYTQNDLPFLNVFINNGDGSFTDRTASYNIKTSAYSVVFGDVDNDADLDMLLVDNQEKNPQATYRLYLNDGSGGLAPVNCGVEISSMDARGAGYGDIDNDGDIDFYIAIKNGENVLFRNESDNSNHYIDVLCTGPQGDLGGFGSRVTIYQPGHLGEPNYILGYQESVSNYSYLCQNQTALHFGLGLFDTCDIRVVLASGPILEYRNVTADRLLETANFVTSILGDVNDDSFANSTDALIISSCDVGLDASQFCPMNCGDVNGDGYINSTDALIILSYDVNLSVPFPVGQTGCHSNVTPCPGCNP